MIRWVMGSAGAFDRWIVAHLVYGGVLGAVFAESTAASLRAPHTRFGPEMAS